jgi:dTDP-4-amino-4,6-dideoxygalactose transaminase
MSWSIDKDKFITGGENCNEIILIKSVITGLGLFQRKIHKKTGYIKMGDTKVWLSSPTMHGEEMRFIQEAFDTNWVAPIGFNVDNFEREVAAYLGIGHAAALVSGTAALHLAVKLAGVKRGDIVFCTDLTFAATVNPVSYEGGVQVFIDSEPETWNMDPRALEKAFEKYPNCKCVICVNLYGVPAKLDEIHEICDRHGAILIEDAAESLGATYKGRQTGTFGNYSILSFNGNKIITTSGGGMLLSNDEAAIKKARFWATQARDPAPWYQHSEIGYNYRMSNIVAGIGRGQLLHLEEHRQLKEMIYRRYEARLKGLPVRLNPYIECSRPNFWLSCITIDKGTGVTPETIRLALERENIESRPIWKPMHLQPVFEDRDFISVNGDVGGDIFGRGLCLPSDIKMTVEQQNKVIDIIKNCF